MLLLDYRDARPIYQQIVDSLRLQIRSGVLEPGEKLPSVRDLAARLSINPNTIQRAYRELEAGGWIVSAAGKGCFVRESPEPVGQRQELLETFDETAKKLMALGIDQVELIARLTQLRGERNA